MFGIFPLLALIVIAFNVVVFGGGFLFGVGDTQAVEGAESVIPIFERELGSWSVMSGDVWTITLGNVFVIVALFLLFIEIYKSTRTDQTSIMNHGLSLVVFIVCLLEFIMMNGFGNSTFFLIMAMTLLDVVAGYTITISTARRDLGVGEGVFGGV